MARDASTTVGEDELVRAARGGDNDARAELVRRYQPPAYGLAVRLLGSREEARDAVQEAFLRAFRQMHSLQGAFGPWFFRILVNLCYDTRRRRRRARVVPLNGEERADDEPDFALRELVRLALARLPERYQTVLLLRDVQGFSTAETAEALGTTEGTARVLLLRARRRLAQILEELERSEHR